MGDTVLRNCPNPECQSHPIDATYGGEISFVRCGNPECIMYLDATPIEEWNAWPRADTAAEASSSDPTLRLIRKIVEAEEGSSLVIHAPSADFGHPLPDWVVDYDPGWSGEFKEFRADTLAECLEKALEAQA